MSNNIKESIKNFLVETFFLDLDTIELNDDTSFLDSGIIDSTGIMEVISHVEENYDITIEDDEMIPENLDSLNNLENFIGKKRS